MTIQLRPWNLNDLDRLVTLANHPDVARFMSDLFPHPYTREAGEKFIHWTIQNCPSTIMAIIADDQVAGSIGIHPQTDILRTNAEIGYWLGKDYWGMGIMSEAVRMMVPAGFEAYPQIQRIFGRVFGGNAASERVLEKAGFVQEGFFRDTLCKAGRHYDELIYAIRR
ncbi:GNAT family N-acetyltransferase [Rurimicrobium arvi]|uniref:GNAT family N-acetyltransferase n=1 Tax=Rurimicrobium arvi TaxID=2049916 RepID=A0ABP8MF55_9BACT